jgi:alkaline phosphatase D
MNRRGFVLRTLLGLGGAPLVAPLASGLRFSGNPFTLGIASGDVTDNSVVLWTRLAPEPQQVDGGMPAVTVPVQWELAEDSNMSRLVQTGEFLAGPNLAHSVHVDVQGLEANQHYWYRFRVGAHSSPPGRTRTLLDRNANSEQVRFITASCQNYSHGYFVAYEHMLQDNPDFVIHLGDYIYDTSFGATFRKHETEKRPETLNDFRRRHALYKTDEHLQRVHAQIPFFTTIDNHDAIEDRDPDKFAQRIAAYQAWYEHMPVRGYSGPGANHFDLLRKIQLGDLAQISLLDVRQFRDKRDLCRDSRDPDYGFGNYRERCREVMKEERTMLGDKQEKWLINNLRANTSAWNVIASPGPFLPFAYHHNEKILRYIGAWDAYPANRKRIADSIKQSSSGHPLILSGDVHSFWALDGSLSKTSSEQIPVVEFVTSSISANWPAPLAKPVSDNLKHNPQVKYYEPHKRGYLLHEVDKAEWKTFARAVKDVKDEQSSASTLVGFLVSRGKPGFTQTS